MCVNPAELLRSLRLEHLSLSIAATSPSSEETQCSDKKTKKQKRKKEKPGAWLKSGHHHVGVFSIRQDLFQKSSAALVMLDIAEEGESRRDDLQRVATTLCRASTRRPDTSHLFDVLAYFSWLLTNTDMSRRDFAAAHTVGRISRCLGNLARILEPAHILMKMNALLQEGVSDSKEMCDRIRMFSEFLCLSN